LLQILLGQQITWDNILFKVPITHSKQGGFANIKSFSNRHKNTEQYLEIIQITTVIIKNKKKN